MQQLFELPQLQAERNRQNRPYLEFLRVPELSAGVYVLPAGSTDEQQPHHEAEIYYVVSGRGRMRLLEPEGKERNFTVAPQQVIFIPAGQEHRFHSIEEELTLLVVFAPAESGP